MTALINSTVEYEAGQSQQAFAAMTDAGAHTIFTLATKPWSAATGFEYAVVPYGIATGGVISPAAAAGNNNVDVAAFTAYAPGMTGASATTGLISVSAATNIAATRGTTNGYRITSITVDSTGTVVAVPGTESTAFSETRGAAGGPPLIPVGSIEIGQVRFSGITAAVVASTEIYQVVGTHQERYDYPVWSEDPIRGQVTFSSALPLIHTGPVAKKVMARVATPIFAVIEPARNWKPADVSNSASSEQYYNHKTVGSFTTSQGQASFDVSLNDGVSDAVLSKMGLNLLWRYKPDLYRTPYQITQGVGSIARTNTAGASPTATITISVQQPSVDFAS